MDESTEFFLLGSATSPDPITLSRLAVFYGEKIRFLANLRICSNSVRMEEFAPSGAFHLGIATYVRQQTADQRRRLLMHVLFPN